jgi:choline dehydrogenase
LARGVAGLRVIDGSVMPVITSGNPNSPIIMIADKAAGLIRADRKREVSFDAAAAASA